jgi:riboflavin kinase/FMN adenylyltransferase
VQLEQELASFSSDKDSLITIGVFDGVHIGHKYLIVQLKKHAKQQGLRAIAITFDRHPQEILNPDSQPPYLTDIYEKAHLLKLEGLDEVIVLSFTPELSRVGARKFLELLREHLRMRGLVIGPDFALGKNNEGNIPTLIKLGEEMGFSVTVIPPVVKNGDTVSSTAIRLSLAKGNMEKVEKLMGHPFSLHGKVIHGKGRGKDLGFPTVNLDISPGQALPAEGVYATIARVENKTFPSVTNIGTNPTFGKNKRTVEAFLIGFNNEIYTHQVRIDFIKKIRDEIKFSDANQLKNQIEQDILTAISILSQESPDKGH